MNLKDIILTGISQSQKGKIQKKQKQKQKKPEVSCILYLLERGVKV